MANFQDLIFTLQAGGVIDVLIPFLLIFTVVFAIFQKTKILGKQPDARRYNIIVALAMGLATVVPHTLWGSGDPTSPYLVNGMVDVVNVINNSLPNISVTVIAIVMVMLLLGVFGADLNLAGASVSGIVMFIAAATVIYVFGTNAGFFGNGIFPRWLWFLQDPNTQSLLVMILVFGVIIWFITRDDTHKDKQEDKKPNWIKALDEAGKEDHH